tara:strand:+ start:22661 stop:23566 length:906 start_codon:yes stop_codon:yes gene_type:complete
MINYLKYRFKNLLNNNKKRLGELYIAHSKTNYNKIKNIRDAEIKIFSQFGEDGIINFLLHKLNIKNNISFVEIGTGDYEEANTRFLSETMISRGLLIDKIQELKFIEKRDFFWKNDIYYCQKSITSKNINNILKQYGFINNFNLLSIDVDGNDYWILEKIDISNCDLVIAEYNPIFGANLSLTVPDEDHFNRDNYNKIFYGSSLLAMINLMNSKNFFFIGSNKACNNAFFVNKKKGDLFVDIEIEKNEKYVDFKFRELKKNTPSENQIKNLLKKIENYTIYDLDKKQLTKIMSIKSKLFDV